MRESAFGQLVAEPWACHAPHANPTERVMGRAIRRHADHALALGGIASNVPIEEVVARISLQKAAGQSSSRIGLTSLCTFWDGV
jgi:hypothetical protein